MADEIENLMLEHLKRFQAVLDRVERKLDDLTRRVGKLNPGRPTSSSIWGLWPLPMLNSSSRQMDLTSGLSVSSAAWS